MTDKLSRKMQMSNLLNGSDKNIANRNFITDTRQTSKSTADTLKNYTIKKVLGEGAFGKVKLALHNHSKQKVAIKILEKKRIKSELDRKLVSRELQILKILRHPNIMQLYEILEDDSCLYLITEFAGRGELLSYITSRQRVNENAACRFFQQLIDGLEYIHKINVVHRDLKPENLLIDDKDNIKIADFGLSNVYKEGERLRTGCGSPAFAAPEMIRFGRYHPPGVDVWSSGVILYTMLAGYLPFEGSDTQDLYKKILKGKFKIPAFFSLDAVDLLNKMLVVTPKKRISIAEIKSHKWFKLYRGYTDIPKGLIMGYNEIPIDNAIVKKVEAFGYDREVITQSIKNYRHNKISTLYTLLLKKEVRNGYVSGADIESIMFKPKVLPEVEKLNLTIKEIIAKEEHRGGENIQGLKKQIHTDIENKIETQNVNNLNNTTLMSFEENISQMSPKKTHTRERGKSSNIFRSKLSQTQKAKKSFNISELMNNDEGDDLQTVKTSKPRTRKKHSMLTQTMEIKKGNDLSSDEENMFKKSDVNDKGGRRKTNKMGWLIRSIWAFREKN